MDSQASTATVLSTNEHPSNISRALLAGWPKVCILSTHLSADEVNTFEERVESMGGTVTYDPLEATIFMTAINSPRRARFELQARGIKFEVNDKSQGMALGKRKRKNSAASGDQPVLDNTSIASSSVPDIAPGHFIVIKLDWLANLRDGNTACDIQPYVVFQANFIVSQDQAPAKLPMRHSTFSSKAVPKDEAPTKQTRSSPLPEVEPIHPHGSHDAARRTHGSNVTRQLLHETTSEHDEALLKNLPDLPDWVKEHKIYACERVALLHSPNDAFIELLKKIRLARTLILDDIGVRAYSTSIAAIAAYPYALVDPREILQLPGCEQKIGVLFHEYQRTGQVEESKAIEKDEILSVLESFYNIWGVGAKTAREFYYDRGWRDTDDIIQYGWNTLNRVQQIGLKYYDEFEQKIPRSEVEFIASVVTYHARQVVDEDITCTIVGGYRRGKKESGDVDMIISHPRENGTLYLIKRLVSALEKAKWITHTLTISETNSARNQEPLGLKPDPNSKAGGFDTLDKALVVWQDPSWPSREADLAENPKAKNPNVHRRVDIIISPWRTVGCAVAGWTSGTTFQRDLRRYAKARKGWKFDSSGCRDRVTGRWLDLEHYTDPETRAKTPLEAERRVFEGFGLEWREPEERCSG